MDQPPPPQPPPPKKPLFDGVVYFISPTLPPLRADQLRLVLNTKGGVEVLPPSSSNGSVTPLSSRAEYRNEIQAAREALADPRLTHVVTNTLNNCEEGWRDVLLSREERDSARVAVVTDLWVDKSVALDSVQPTDYYSADPFMIFSGVVACASELPATDLEVLSAGITALGGQWRTGLTKDVTHLFCISPGTPPPNLQELGTFEHVGSLKYATALKNQHTTHVKVLLPHWFDDIMKIGIPGLDTKPYEWPDPELLKGPESILIPGVDGPESLKANEKIKEREKEREERMKKDSLLREEDTFKKSLYATAGLVSPGAALPSDVSMNGDADSAQGVKAKDIWKGRRVLLGRSLELLGSRREAVEAGLRRTGAIIVEHSPSASSVPLSLRKLDAEREKELIEECDVFVTRFRSGRAYASAVRLGKTIGTLSWLFHVQKTGVVSPPMDQLLWYPIPKRKIEGFEAHEITLTNYTGEAREYLKKLITIMGANFTPSMSGRNTVLIAAYISGTKTTKAASWSIPIVNHLWLEDCFIKWRNLTPALERYIHFPTGIDFSNLLGERGIGKRVEDEMGDEELDQLEAEEDEEFGVKPPESRASEPKPNGAPLNTQNSMKEVMEVEAAVNELDVPMDDVPEVQQEREPPNHMEVDEPEPEPAPKPKDPPKPANGIPKSFATRLKEKVLEKDKDSESPAKTRVRPRKSSGQKKFSLDSSSSSRSPSPQPLSPMQASTSKKKLTRRAGEKHDSWIRDEDDDDDEVQVVAVKLSPKKPAPRKRHPREGETEDEEIVQATSSPDKLFGKGDDSISDGDPSQPKRVPYSPKKYKSQNARRKSKGAQEEEEESANEDVSPAKSAGKGKAAQSTSAIKRHGAKQVQEESVTEEEASEEEQPKSRPRGRPRKSLPTREEEEEEEEEPVKSAPKPRGRPKKTTKQAEESAEEEEESPQKETKGPTPKKLPNIRELTDSEDDMPPATSANMLAKKAPAKPTPPKRKGKAPKKQETPLPVESEEEEEDGPPPPTSVKIGPPRGKKKQVPTATTTTKKVKAQTSDDEDEDLHQSPPKKTPNRASVVLTDRHSSKKKMAFDGNPPSRKNAVGKTESILVTAGERAGPLARVNTAQAKDSPKSRMNGKKAEDPAPSSPLTAMEVDDDVGTPATESGRSKRTAATKATKKLHEEIMPDVLNYQHEVKQDRRRKSLGLPPSVGSFESQKGKKKREAAEEEEDSKEARDKKKRKMGDEQEEEPISAKPSKGKQKEAKAEISGNIDAGIRLMTTQVNLSDDVIKALTKLGVRLTTRPLECTHLLVPHLVRTEKFLCALAQAPFIMKEAWAKDSAAQKKLLDEKPYLLRDKANEARYEFVLSEALERAKEHKESGGLFFKKVFYVTPKVPVDRKLLKNVVESGGGTMSNQTPTPRIIGMNPEDRIVVSCPEDLNIWRPLASAGYPIYLPEIILASTLKQEIDWDNNAFKVAASK